MEKNLCLICLGESLPENKTYSSKNRKYYQDAMIFSANCNCNVYMHDLCMVMWINKKAVCPICMKDIIHKKILRLSDIYVFFDNRKNVLRVYLIIIKLWLFITWIVLCNRNNLSTKM